MPSTLTTFAAFVKTYFNPQKVENLTKTGKPLYSMIKKNTAISGNPWQVPIQYANPQGISTDLANAQVASAGVGGNVQGVAWSIQVGDYSGSVTIGDKAIRATRNNVGAFLENKAAEIEGLYEQASQAISTYLWRNGGGAIGQRSGALSGNIVTLVQAADTFNFEVGMTVVAASDDGSGVADNRRTGSTTVSAVDRISGTVTLTNAAALIGFVASDFLFRLGDYAGSVVPLFVKGVDAFVTSSVTPGVLWGVTRTTDVQRLSGCKVSATDLGGKGIEERIQLLGAYMAGRYKAMTDGGDYRCFLHPEDWQNLALSVQSRGIRMLNGETAEVNFEYIEILAAGKRIKTFSDPFASKGNAYILRMEDWVLGSYGDLLTVPEADGLQLLRAANTNNYEYRLLAYPAVSCKAPGFQGRVALP